MGSRWRFAVLAGGACAFLVACSGLVAPQSAPATDAGIEVSAPPPPATDAMSSPDAPQGEPVPTDAGSVDVFHYSPPCSDGGSSCGQAKVCAQDVVYWLDTGDTTAGVHLFVQEQDAAAYARSLGFQGSLTDDYAVFTFAGDPYVFAQLGTSAFAVVDGAVDPDVYAGIIRYEQCTYPEDASADAEDGATE